MTGPEHYRAAETLLKNAKYTAYEDESNDVRPQDEYDFEADYYAAVEVSNEAHEKAVVEATMLATMAQAHATLALAAATALQVRDMQDANAAECLPRAEYEAWTNVAARVESAPSEWTAELFAALTSVERGHLATLTVDGITITGTWNGMGSHAVKDGRGILATPSLALPWPDDVTNAAAPAAAAGGVDQ